MQFQPRVNYLLVSSGIPFIKAIVVHNETGHELGDTTLTAELQMGEQDARRSRADRC